ncbi:hypothetical protein scyTo_0018778 [Scyliorhinus torazame]|uniref:Mitochondrial nucleoid factor 1 n=1 Tax=Scyliorhinus torazame TaxID=75743 RepID=A0A401Q2I3_SCYTO|nr:hypothetical protein [Scyliorhinus torazame]
MLLRLPVLRSRKAASLALSFGSKWCKVSGKGESIRIINPEKCDLAYGSLTRIHTAYYKNKSPHLRITGFTGVTVEECQMVLATSNMKQMEETKKGLWKKLREKFTGKPEDVTKEYDLTVTSC